MTQASGWGLTARLVSKHFSALGGRLAEAIATFDPETATEADRDQLQKTLQQTAQKLAAARISYAKERKDVVDLQTLVANDEKASDILAERLTAGTISEATVNSFLDELEANKSKLPTEQLEEASAKELMDELDALVQLFSKQLNEFDATAKKARQAQATAQAQIDLQRTRQQSQEQLAGLRASATGTSTALGALNKRTAKLQEEAAGMKIVTDLAQKPLDQANEIDAIRKSVAQGSGATETTLERLKRLSAAKADVPA